MARNPLAGERAFAMLPPTCTWETLADPVRAEGATAPVNSQAKGTAAGNGLWREMRGTHPPKG